MQVSLASDQKIKIKIKRSAIAKGVENRPFGLSIITLDYIVVVAGAMVLAAVIVRMGPLFGPRRSILVRLDIVKCADELRVCVRARLSNVSCWSWRRRGWISINTSLTIVLV